MYYGNLKNTELKTYHHHAKIRGFNFALYNMQNSKLFKVQSLGNDLYKVYPLFYVDEIRCELPNVKILSNQCVILHETETSSNQTIISFINNDYSDSYTYRNYLAGSTTGSALASQMPYLDIGDTLTTSKYNNLVQVIRDNIPLSNPIKMKNGLIHGEFGDYQFNMTDVSLTDKGILITDETLSNGVTVTLLNPVYQYSTYKLILTVATISDVHLDNSSTDNYYDTTPLEVTLNPNTAVTIPIENLEENRVILYDAEVRVKHDQPYVQQIIGIASINVNTTGYILESTTLTAKYEGGDVSGKTITFKMKKIGDTNPTTLGTSTTDANGVATYTVTNSQLSTTGDYIFYAVDSNGHTATSTTYTYKNYSTQLVVDSISYDKDTKKISASGRWINTDTNSLVPVTRTLSISWNNGSSTYSGSTSITNGEWSYVSSTTNILGTTTIYFLISSMSGVIGYNQPSTANVEYTVPYDTYINGSDVTEYNNNVREVSGYLFDELDRPVSNREVTVKFEDGMGENYATVTGVTNNQGKYSMTTSFSFVMSKVTATFNGDSLYNACSKVNLWSTSITKTITQQGSALNYVISGQLLYKTKGLANKSLTLTVAKTYHGTTNYEEYTVTTGTNGAYSQSVTVSSDNISVSAKVVFSGDSQYGPCINDYND